MKQNSTLLLLLVIVTTLTFDYLVVAHPLTRHEAYRNQSESFQYLNESNDTSQDLIVIRTVVYEVGILTNSDDNETSYESSEQVDLTFFDPKRNESAIDLSDIPIPIRTNLSQISVTGVAPGNLGVIQLPETDDGNGNVTFTSPVLPNAVVTVTRHVSTTDANKTQEILDQISPIVDIPNLHIRDLQLKDNGTNSVLED